MARHGKAHDLVNLQRISAGLARTVLLLQPTGAPLDSPLRFCLWWSIVTIMTEMILRHMS
jgi:hypothetical protein